ncbi:copper chaperone PCu(A)C [Streptomyces mexicanus]|uniref:copper chaperone PCu(A)C n=1 Tax=Streptomyces mexicanus TaxID=178566 RepID=UPI0036CE24B6
MSSSLRRGALAAAAIAFSIASLAACGAGNDAQTLQIKPDNAATTVGDIRVQNAVIITQPDAQTKGPAVVSVTLFNNGDSDQTLDAIRVDGDGSAQLTPASGKGKVTIPAHGSLILGGKGNASAALSDPGASVQNGNAQKITFTFSKAGDVSLRAYVVPAQSYFDKWGPSKAPAAPGATGSPAASASASSGESGKPDVSTSPSQSASGSASESAGATASPSDSASQSAAGH